MRQPTQLQLRALRRLSNTPLVQRVLASVWPRRLQQVGRRIVEQTDGRWPTLNRLLVAAFDTAESWLGYLEPAPLQRTPAPTWASAPASPKAATTTDDELRKWLQELAKSPDWSRRLAAVKALSNSDDSKVTASLIAALIDSSVEVAVAAAEALSSCPRIEAQHALRSLVDHHDGYVSPLTRAAALAGLAREDGGRILAAISDLDAEVSLAAIAILGEASSNVSQADAVNALQQVSSDTSGYYAPIVHEAATKALQQLSKRS